MQLLGQGTVPSLCQLDPAAAPPGSWHPHVSLQVRDTLPTLAGEDPAPSGGEGTLEGCSLGCCPQGPCDAQRPWDGGWAGPAARIVQEGAQCYCGSFQLANRFKRLCTAAESGAESLCPWCATVDPGWGSKGCVGTWCSEIFSPVFLSLVREQSVALKAKAVQELGAIGPAGIEQRLWSELSPMDPAPPAQLQPCAVPQRPPRGMGCLPRASCGQPCCCGRESSLAASAGREVARRGAALPPLRLSEGFEEAAEVCRCYVTAPCASGALLPGVRLRFRHITLPWP